ncbi:hypothetical protein [Undibacterium sp.]|uniref:hypothetical protein n=1 Tax=Undibacterium sp. TaxID=1914977 RepID=UPI0025FE0918|nr:hypothetical protein [Undibacterium sp.]
MVIKNVKNLRYLEQRRKIVRAWKLSNSNVPPPSLEQWQQAMSIVEEAHADQTDTAEQSIALKAIESTIIHLGISNFALVNLAAVVDGGSESASVFDLGSDALQLSRLVGQQLGLNAHYRERLHGLIYYYAKKPEQVVNIDLIVANYVPQQRLKIALEELIQELEVVAGSPCLKYETAVAMLDGAGAVMMGSALCQQEATRTQIENAKKSFFKNNTSGFGKSISQWCSRLIGVFS